MGSLLIAAAIATAFCFTPGQSAASGWWARQGTRKGEGNATASANGQIPDLGKGRIVRYPRAIHDISGTGGRCRAEAGDGGQAGSWGDAAVGERYPWGQRRTTFLKTIQKDIASRPECRA